MIGLPPLAGALYCDIHKTPPSYYCPCGDAVSGCGGGRQSFRSRRPGARFHKPFALTANGLQNAHGKDRISGIVLVNK